MIISYGPLAYCFIDPEGRTYFDVLLDVVVVYDEVRAKNKKLIINAL